MHSPRDFILNSGRLPRFAAFFFVTAATTFLLDRVIPERTVTVRSCFAVSNRNSAANRPQSGDARADFGFDLFVKSQIALLKSDRLLNTAAKESSLDSLAIFQNRNPVVWLRKHLDIIFQEDDGVLEVNLYGLNSQKRDLSTIVNAVATAYNDALAVQLEMAPLIAHDLAARGLPNLNFEIQRKLDEYLDIVRESGPPPRKRLCNN